MISHNYTDWYNVQLFGIPAYGTGQVSYSFTPILLLLIFVYHDFTTTLGGGGTQYPCETFSSYVHAVIILNPRSFPFPASYGTINILHQECKGGICIDEYSTYRFTRPGHPGWRPQLPHGTRQGCLAVARRNAADRFVAAQPSCRL